MARIITIILTVAVAILAGIAGLIAMFQGEILEGICWLILSVLWIIKGELETMNYRNQ
jgi:hypothetical protein